MRAIAAVILGLVACQPFTPGPPQPGGQPSSQMQAQASGPPGMEAAALPEQTEGTPEDPYQRRPPPPPPPQQQQPPPSSSLPTAAQAMVDQHNAARAKHCVPPVTWSTKLADVAQQWANSLRDHDCAFEHSQGKYGENLAAGTTGYMDPAAVVAMWYGEIKDYSYDRPGFSMTTGHFTQVVWKGTAQVGCGMSQCKGMDVWVCEYDPPGNWDGQFKQNVPPPCK